MKKRMALCLMVIAMVASVVVGCSNDGEAQNVTLDIPATWTKIESHVEMGMMSALDDEMLPTLYEGIPMDKLASYSVHMSMINVRADEIAMFEAVDTDAVADIKSAVEARQAALDQQWSTYLPDQHENVKNAIIKTEGKYVFFIVGDFASDVETIIEESMSK